MSPGSHLPELGVGITYVPAIEPLVEVPGLLDILEVEPQTLWQETGNLEAPHRMTDAVLRHLVELPLQKLIHSIGVPVGGSVRPEKAQLDLLCTVIHAVRSPWISEHLSFNRTHEHSTGYFLPPRQTRSGVESAVRSIATLQEAFKIPVAVETGVNYLQVREDESRDGAFVRAVADTDDCGILLDLHNVFSNALNGRQPMDEFVEELPLDRVWEIHIAGGFELEGYWVDAHSGAMPDELFEAAKSIISRLPNLKAIIFEIFPSFIPLVSFDVIREQLLKIRELWDLRNFRPSQSLNRSTLPDIRDWDISQEVWERALGSLVIGRPASDPFAVGLSLDPGVRLINRMACEFRASMVVNVFRLTSRLLLLSVGPDVFRTLLEDFWLKEPPQGYASAEAQGFISYLDNLDLAIPQLGSVIKYEQAVVATLLDGKARVVAFKQDPFPMLRALAEGKLPTIDSQFGEFEIEIVPDSVYSDASIVSSPAHSH